MTEQNSLRRSKLLPVSALLLVIAVTAGLIFLFSIPKPQKKDYERIDTEFYNAVFLSMFPIDNFDEESFAYWRGQALLKADYNVPDLKTIRSYLKRIANSGNEISFIYLGICPDKISAAELLTLLQEYPSVQYQILLPYPQISYWQALSEEELSETLNTYRTAADTLMKYNNCHVYLFSKEWLVCNPANYEDTFLTTADSSLTLMLNCDQDHPYVLTPETTDDAFLAFQQLLTREYTAPDAFPDLAGQEIIFFGDSVIGNYTDSASIPGVVGGLTNATVYNLGYGGHHAASTGEDIALPDIIEAFIDQDLSVLPQDKQVYKGMSAYLETSSGAAPSCFIINYGLNDYFDRLPISSPDDPFDSFSFEGALRTAVTDLQKQYPDARIILMTPNYTSYSEPSEPSAESTPDPFCDYVNAVRTVGDECGVTVLDNYADLGINGKNHGLYLSDGVHPNEATRFLIGKRIAQALSRH